MKQFRSDTPEMVEQIIRRSLEKTTARRYCMGLDMASDLSLAFTYLDRPQEDISIKEKFDRVKQIEFFRGFPDSEIWEIIRASVWVEADVDDKIVTEGDVENSFFIIMNGDVTISKTGHFVGQLHEGDCFGEMGYLNRIKRTATVTADGLVSLMKVNSTLIEQVTSDCQLRFYRVFLKILIDRLSKTTEMMVRDAVG